MYTNDPKNVKYVNEEISYIHSERERLAARAKNEVNPHLRRYMMFQRDFLLVRLNQLLTTTSGISGS